MALKVQEVGKLYNHRCKELSSQDWAKDLWFFSYFMNGANINDVARLKYRNDGEEFITFYRNKHMNDIANEVGIHKRIITYTARHSFPTVLERSGVSKEFIGESLGHYDLKTTELYLDSFEDDMKKEVAKHLTALGS